MSRFSADGLRWKERRAFRLSNDEVEVTVLLGGGHIADLRLCGSPNNALWEAPWPTIEPYEFSDRSHLASYGDSVTGRMLSGYTGHALAIPYFGMPSVADAGRGLALHGEAASAEWQIAGASVGKDSTSVTLVVDLPVSGLYVQRTLQVAPNTTTITVIESVRNTSSAARELQWVEHVAFGEPLFTPGESSLILSGDHAITWPLGYEGNELLPSDLKFLWPHVAGHDLSAPFIRDGTGFVAAVRVNPRRTDGYIAVHNRKSAMAAGYVFDARRFPWIALWEENRARNYPPWNGRTRVRGVEFGTSPMPLGIENAQRMHRLFDTPVFGIVGGGAVLSTSYQIFVARTPCDWQSLRDIRRSGGRLLLESESGADLLI